MNSTLAEIKELKLRLDYLEKQYENRINFDTVIKKSPFPASNIRYSKSKRVKQLSLCRIDPEQSASNLMLAGPSATMIMWCIDKIIELEKNENV